MTGPNSLSNNPENQGDIPSQWDSLVSIEMAESDDEQEPLSSEMPDSSPTERIEETRDAVFQIYTENFRTRMARQLAEEYLNARSESNVETSELDREIEDEGKKATKKRFLRFFRKNKGAVKNTVQNGLARSGSTANAVKVILGENDSDDPKLAELRKRLDELTEQYVEQSKARYKKAVSEDAEHFDSSGQYTGALAAKGELRRDDSGTEKVNGVIDDVVSRRKEFVAEDGSVDEDKLSAYVAEQLKKYPQVVEECVEKCSSLIAHEAAFDRAKDGMAVYSANLVGGASRKAKGEALERIRNRSFHTIPAEVVASAAGTAAVLTRGDVESLAVGVGAVGVAHGVKRALRIGRDRRVVTEARSNNLETLGENAGSDKVILGNGEEPSVMDGLTVNDESIPVSEALHYSNDKVQKIRKYERDIASIGAYEMAGSQAMIDAINDAIESRDIQKIIAATAEAESRLGFVYDKGKAVIRFSSVEQRPKEEQALREAIFRAKKIIEGGGDDIQRSYEDSLGAFNKDIGKDIKSKDRALLRREIIEGLRSGLKAGVIAALGFIGVQELVASFDDSTMGFFETMLGKNGDADKQTIASRIFFGPMQRDVQTGESTQTIRIDNLSEEDAEAYRGMGYEVRQTGENVYSVEKTISNYMIDGRPAEIVFGDNNTKDVSEGLERSMHLVDGKLSMPLEGTATSSMDGGATTLDWGEMIKNGEAGVVKILPDGTGEFMSGVSIDSGRVLLGDGSISPEDLKTARYCATVLQDGKYTIFASEGMGTFKKIEETITETTRTPVFSAIMERMRPIIEKVAYGISFIGLIPTPIESSSLGKFVTLEEQPRGEAGPDDIPPVPPEPIDGGGPGNIVPPVDDGETPSGGTNPPSGGETPTGNDNPPSGGETPTGGIDPPSGETPTGGNPPGENTPIDDGNPPSGEAPTEDPNPPSGGEIPGGGSIPPVDGETPTGGELPPTDGGEIPGGPTGGPSGPGGGEGPGGGGPRPWPGGPEGISDGWQDRLVFIDSSLEGQEMLDEEKRRFINITGEQPFEFSHNGVYESEHYIMEWVAPITSGHYEHGNIETDMLDRPNVMYKISRKK